MNDDILYYDDHLNLFKNLNIKNIIFFIEPPRLQALVANIITTY